MLAALRAGDGRRSSAPRTPPPGRCRPRSSPRSPAASSASTGCTSPRGSRTRSTQAATLAEEGGVFGEAIGSGAVLVTGSVVTVGEARHLLRPRGTSGVNRSIRRSMCAAMLVLQAVVLFLTGVVIDRDDRPRRRRVARARASVSRCCACWRPGCSAGPGGYALGWTVQVVSIGLGFVITAMFFLGACSRRCGRRRTSWGSRSTGRRRSVRCWSSSGGPSTGHRPHRRRDHQQAVHDDGHADRRQQDRADPEARWPRHRSARTRAG